MRAFLLQVAKSDALAESGLKVIAYFDALVEHRATLEACVRAAAALSQCVAGLRDHTSPVFLRVNHRGLAVDGPPVATTRRPVRIGDRDVGEVWLEREEGPVPLDELIVERLALAAGVLWRASPRPGRSTAGLVELVLSTGSASEDRARAFQLLGFSPAEPVDVAAVATDDPDLLAVGLSDLCRSIRERHPVGGRTVVCSALVGNIGAVLAQPGLIPVAAGNGALQPDLDMDNALVAGTARRRAPDHVAEAWQQAQTAMRFCGLLGHTNVVDHDELGSLALLAQLPTNLIAANSDVTAIEKLTDMNRGSAVLETLERRLASGSIREAAAALYLHHSSVRYRLRRAEECLGLQLDDPRSRLRAELALILWRLSQN